MDEELFGAEVAVVLASYCAKHGGGGHVQSWILRALQDLRDDPGIVERLLTESDEQHRVDMHDWKRRN